MCPLFFVKFLSLTKLYPFKMYEKCFLFHLKSSFHSTDIQFFVFLSSHLFLPVSHCFRGWSKINLKVCDVINCLVHQTVNILFGILWRKTGMTLKLCPLIEYWIRNICIGKLCRKCAPELVPDPFLILVNNPKQLLLAINSFKYKIF